MTGYGDYVLAQYEEWENRCYIEYNEYLDMLDQEELEDQTQLDQEEA